MKILHTQNPLKTRVELDKRDVSFIRKSLEIEELENAIYQFAPDKYVEIIELAASEIERCLPYYLSALADEIHCGDCTKVPCSCTKCHAEAHLEIDTLIGIRSPYYAGKAFDEEGVETLDQAIQYLKNNPAKVTWEGSEPYVAGWQLQQDQTIEDLVKYRDKHFGQKEHE